MRSLEREIFKKYIKQKYSYRKKESGRVKRITAFFAMIVFDKEYFTVAQPSGASTAPRHLAPRGSRAWVRHGWTMGQSNAARSGKDWKNSPEKKAEIGLEPPRPGLNGQEWGFVRLNPMVIHCASLYLQQVSHPS